MPIATPGGRLADPNAERSGCCLSIRAKENEAEESSGCDDRQLQAGAWHRDQKRGSQECKSGTLAVRAKGPAHAPNGLGDDGDGKQFQPVDKPLRSAALA